MSANLNPLENDSATYLADKITEAILKVATRSTDPVLQQRALVDLARTRADAGVISECYVNSYLSQSYSVSRYLRAMASDSLRQTALLYGVQS